MTVGTYLSLSAQSQQISLDEAKMAAITRVANQKQISRSTISVSDAAYWNNDNGNTLIYEIVTDKGVTVLLSGNRKCKPILGIHGNDEGLLLNKYDSLPCGMQYIFDCYKDQVNNSFFDHSVETRHNNEWQSLIIGESSLAPRTGYVEPLLKSLWSQKSSFNNTDDDAYNYFMPTGDDCEHCLAGCVAVAMGQVMYYWKHPVLINSREVQFDWCKMVDTLYSGLLFPEERNAISYLLLECGKAVDMVYGCSGSSAHTEDARDALVDDFGYKNTADYKNRSQYSDNEWINLLEANIGRGKPVIYRGRTSANGGSGHAFVCDGFNQYEEFHFNWGWGRNFSGPNDYYTLNDLQPNEYNFQFHQGAIFGLEPDIRYNICDVLLYLDDFYGNHTSHNHPLYTATPKTMTTLISASLSSPASYRTIPAGATAEYVAHKEVILQPGFTAEYGSDFTAKIEPCAACEERMVQVDVLTENDDWQGIDTSQMEMRMYKKGDTAILFQPSALTLFPNPTSNTLTVQAPNPAEDIQIFDLAGHRVYRWYIESRTDSSTTLNIADIPTGNYILRIQTKDGKSHIGRFAKK